nr:PREDICTED: uncharacterized protein LOC108199617 [Daucus carota subsp. sativus]
MADTLVEEREEVMVPANSGNPIFRKAHFLKPMITEHNLLLSPPPNPLLFSKPCFQKLENCTLQSYKGLPSEKWKLWVQSLRPRYQETWKKAGIYHAILASTHTIPKDKMLIFGLAERWCADTNSFIFPWGEMWAWERFAGLRPAPNIIGRGEPRSLRWNGVKNSEVDDVRSALSSAELVFVWRPYVSSNSMLSNLCRDDEQWVVVDSDALESFARCLRTSELVGLGYTEQYLPHRVAMQFGLDQDIPHVVRLGGNPETGWTSYNRPLRGVKLFIPPRLFKADVTSRYVTWYRKTILLCTNETMESGMQNMWSSYKCRKSKPFTENQSGPKECAVITRNSNLTNKPVEMSSHSMSSNTRKEGKSTERQTKLEQYGEVSPEDNIANVVDESYEDTATELQHLGLEARICRLERIFDKIKAARFCASSQTDVDN